MRRIDAVVIARIAIVGVVIGAPAAFVEPLRGTERGHVLRLVGNGCEEVAVDLYPLSFIVSGQSIVGSGKAGYQFQTHCPD